MDTLENQNPPEQQEPYKERPRYQVWAARVGLVIMVISIALYLYHLASGGMR